MRPQPWSPPVEMSEREARMVKRLRKKGRFYVFLREHRHEILTAEVQAELAGLYKKSAKGQPPILPERLALATLLQAYLGLSDEDTVDATQMDKRWQLVLDWWNDDDPAFAQGTLVHFRQRLQANNLDRVLIERTVAVAEEAGGFGRRQLKLALDSSPIWGAGRVEDTINLLGTALSRAVAALGKLMGRSRQVEATVRGLPELAGSSVKAALDLDWREPEARDVALARLLGVLERLEEQLAEEPAAPARVNQHLTTARQVVAQDVTTTAAGTPTIRQGVAPDRRISVAEREMRHGRKSKAVRFDGYKQHAVRDLGQAGIIRAVGVTPANRPEAEVAPAVLSDLARQHLEITEWHVDRAYLRSQVVTERPSETVIWCKPYLVQNKAQFPKTAFAFDKAQKTLTCPAGVTQSGTVGQTVRFPADRCDSCGLRPQCTRARPGTGRSVALHPEEVRLEELRAALTTSEGRTKFRERVGVEHSLARIHQIRGDVARYRGLRKQIYETRIAAAVVNLQLADRLRTLASTQIT